MYNDDMHSQDPTWPIPSVQYPHDPYQPVPDGQSPYDPYQPIPNAPPPPPNDPPPPYSKKIFLGIVAALIASFAFAGSGETDPLNLFLLSIYTALLMGAITSMLVIDWRGFFSLDGLIKWKSMDNNKRMGMGCLFVFVSPIFIFIYLVRAGIRVFQTQEQIFSKEWDAPEPIKRRAKAGVISGVIVAFVFATLVGTGAVGATTAPTTDSASIDATPLVTQTVISNVPAVSVSPTPTPIPTPTVKPTPTHTPQWTVIQTFQGNGNKKTPTFTVPDDWRLVWSCNPSSSYGGSYNVMADVNNSDGSSLDAVAINTICQAGNIGDFTEEHQGGDVYLDVQSEAAWTMKIEVLR